MQQYSPQEYQRWRNRQKKLDEHYERLSKFRKQELIVWTLLFIIIVLGYISLHFLMPAFAMLCILALVLVTGMFISRIWHISRFKLPEEPKEGSQESDITNDQSFHEPILPINEERLRNRDNF